MPNAKIMTRFKMIVSGYVFFVRDGKILLLKRQNTGYEDGNYGVPSGHIENDEPLIEGTRREMQEEVGVEFKLNQLELVHVMHRKSEDIRIDFFFLAKAWNTEPCNMEKDKCAELAWFDLKALPKNTIPYIFHAIRSYQRKDLYSEFGW